jgi:hypothetical protein
LVSHFTKKRPSLTIFTSLKSIHKHQLKLANRLTILLALCCIITSSRAQIPDYFANDPKWVCGSWSTNQWLPGSLPYSSTFVYYLNGDTIIGEHTYHRLFSNGFTTTPGDPETTSYFDYFTGYSLRQENRSIRFISAEITTDSLLVSYDYQIGDTVQGNVLNQCGFGQETIQKIDSLLIGSEYRRIFYVDSILGPVITEGIGHQIAPNENVGEFILPLCMGLGWDYSIDCFGLGSIPYWSFNGTANCILNVSVEEEITIPSMIYPNPFDRHVTVKMPTEKSAQFHLFDLTGRSVLHMNVTGEVQIPTDFLRNGMYLYEIRLGSTVVKKGRLVKDN